MSWNDAGTPSAQNLPDILGREGTQPPPPPPSSCPTTKYPPVCHSSGRVRSKRGCACFPPPPPFVTHKCAKTTFFSSPKKSPTKCACPTGEDRVAHISWLHTSSSIIILFASPSVGDAAAVKRRAYSSFSGLLGTNGHKHTRRTPAHQPPNI